MYPTIQIKKLWIKSSLEDKVHNTRFICQSLQFYWSQTSHTKSSDEILKPFNRKGFSKQLNGAGLCWEVMKGRGGVVRRWWSGAEMGRSGAVESGGNYGQSVSPNSDLTLKA
nr:hypothetical protein [Tanacetum cinerariifolium]